MTSIGPQFIASVNDLFAHLRGASALLDNTVEGGLQPITAQHLRESLEAARREPTEFQRMVQNPTAFSDEPSSNVFRHLGGNMYGNSID